MIYVASLCVVVLASVIFWQSYWRQQDHAAFARERQEWVLERRDLNNRIQVPQAAPFMSDETTEIPVQHVTFDDDEDFHEAMEEMGVIDS